MALPLPAPMGWVCVGQGTHLPDQRGRAWPGPAGRGARGLSWCVWQRLRGLGQSASPGLQRCFILWAAPEAGVRAGHGGACQGCLGLIRLSSVGQTPKEVVVGAAAPWAGPGNDGGGFASIRDCQPPERVPSFSPRGHPRSPSPADPLSPSLSLSHQWGRLGGEGGSLGRKGGWGPKIEPRGVGLQPLRL